MLTRIHSLLHTLRQCALTALPVSWSTTVWLLEIMLPVSLVVAWLQYLGAIDWAASWLEPLFRLMGLPGQAAVVFLTGALVGTYGGLWVLLSFALTLREATILALMICLCHALPMESAVVRRTGSSFWGMTALRVAMALAAAFWLNLVLPEMAQPFGAPTVHEAVTSGWALMGSWVVSSARMSAFVFAIIYALMVLQRLLEAYRLIAVLSRWLAPLMRLFGLPRSASYMWLVGNVLGISYGCAVIMDLEKRGVMTRREANDVNYHLVMNHSLLEDTCVFAAAGIPALWIVATRVLFAMVVVWGRRALTAFRPGRRAAA